jgi:hypothetical protein
MSFNIIAIREAGESDQPEMYPLLTDERRLAFEAADGRDPRWCTAKALSVGEFRDGRTGHVMAISDISAEVVVTDGRIAVVCTRFDKGGGWVGSPFTSLLLNLVSIVRARIRSRGKAMVGHIRYPWLVSVGFSPKRGFLDANKIRLVIEDGTAFESRTVLFDLTYGKHVDTAAIAADICRRAARQRLARNAEMKEDARSGFERLLDAPRLPDPQPGEFAFYRMPNYWKARPETADLAALH